MDDEFEIRFGNNAEKTAFTRKCKFKCGILRTFLPVKNFYPPTLIGTRYFKIVTKSKLASDQSLFLNQSRWDLSSSMRQRSQKMGVRSLPTA